MAERPGAALHRLDGETGPRWTIVAVLAGLALWFIAPAAVAGADRPPPLRLPIDCVIGTSCVVQNYVDVAPGPGVQDWTCGTRTYQDHNGVDFRLPSMVEQRRGVAVLAAADGIVRGTRDGEPDISIRERGMAAVHGKECGNGLVVDHGQGWTTQYCHMAQGSLRAKEGMVVKAGQPLGLVGLSGQTEYPHLHFTLRHDGKVVEPFALDLQAGRCGIASAGAQAWAPDVAARLAYVERSVLNQGFASGPVTNDDIESGAVPARRPSPVAEALVFYVRAIGLKPGDIQRLAITGPDGHDVVRTEEPPITTAKAQVILFAGRKRTGDRFAAGTYTATYEVVSGDTIVLSARAVLDLAP